jgi:hypothetical protein
MKTLFAAAAAIATLAAVPASAATGINLVTNGGFETTTLTRSQQIAANSNDVAGWTNAANPGGWTNTAYNFLIKGGIAADSPNGGFYSVWDNHDYVYGPNGGDVSAPGFDCGKWGCNNQAANNFKVSPTGGNYLLMDSDTAFNGTISQLITGLKVGTTYNLTFDWAGASWATVTGPTTHAFDVTFGGVTQSTDTLNVDAKGFSGWKTASMNFVATSGSQTLSFLSKGTPNGLPPTNLLDNVSMTAAVPEPATWAMMLVGFGMVGGAARYRRRSTKLSVA